MTALPGYPVFKARDDYEIFIERLHNAFVVNKTPDSDRAAILLNQVDETVYKTLRNLCNPDTPSTKTFDEISSLLKRQYVKEISAWKERRKFMNAVQKKTESVNEWYLRLKMMASNCDFGEDMPELLKNKFVCGLDQAAIFDRIAEDGCKVTMEEILKIAAAKEALLPKPTVVEQEKKPNPPKGPPAEHKPQKKKGDTNDSKPNEGRGPRPQGGKGPATCRHCGQPNHDFSNCQYKNSICNGCQQAGHILAVCWRKNQRPNPEKKTFINKIPMHFFCHTL